MDNRTDVWLTLDLLNDSYFQGIEPGGHHRKYFVYYSQFDKNRETLSGVEATFLAILFFMSISGNSLILLQFVRKRNRNKLKNCFLANLAFSDIIFVLTAPLIATTRISQTWILGKALCHMMMYVMCICGSVSIWTLAAISVERFQLIVKRKSRPMAFRPTIVFIVMQWLTASFAFLPAVLFFNVRTFQLGENCVYICTLIWPPNTTIYSLLFALFLCAVVFVIPLVIMSLNYFRIFRRFWHSRKAVRSGIIDKKQSRWATRRGANQINTVSLQQRRNARDFRAVMILFLLVALFFIMWSPVFVCLMEVQVDETRPSGHMHSQYILAVTCVAYANTCINPVIYGLVNRNLGRDLLKCRKCLPFQRNNTEGESIHTISRH